MGNKFKVGDNVRIKPWDIEGRIYLIDAIDAVLPYLVEGDDGQTSWWLEDELELINEQIS